jgi:hypothetical protein
MQVTLGDNEVRLVTRYLSGSDSLYFFVNASGVLQAIQRTNGGSNWFGPSGTSIATGVVNGDIITAEINGTTVRVRVNGGAWLNTATMDSKFNTSMSAGLEVLGTGFADNFSVSPL